MTMLTRPDQIAGARLATLVSGLKLECLGLKKRGKSCYAILKDEYKLKGNKQRVLEQAKDLLNKRIEAIQEKNRSLVSQG